MHDGVSTRRTNYCIFHRLFRSATKKRKRSKLRKLTHCDGNMRKIHQYTIVFPSQIASSAESVSMSKRPHDTVSPVAIQQSCIDYKNMPTKTTQYRRILRELPAHYTQNLNKNQVCLYSMGLSRNLATSREFAVQPNDPFRSYVSRPVTNLDFINGKECFVDGFELNKCMFMS